MTSLITTENLKGKKQRGSRKPIIRTIASHNSNPPEIRINTAKETKTNAIETITVMKIHFCSYHQLRGHSNAKCCNPCNPRGVNANNAQHNNQKNNCNHNHQQDHSYQTTETIEATSNATTVIQHALSSKGKKTTSNKKLLMTTASTQPTIRSPMMKSWPWKKSATPTTTIKRSSPNKTTYQKLPLVYLPM
jgi:hypothetical protein